jgi:hypothetical protein
MQVLITNSFELFLMMSNAKNLRLPEHQNLELSESASELSLIKLAKMLPYPSKFLLTTRATPLITKGLARHYSSLCQKA